MEPRPFKGQVQALGRGTSAFKKIGMEKLCQRALYWITSIEYADTESAVTA